MEPNKNQKINQQSKSIIQKADVKNKFKPEPEEEESLVSPDKYLALEQRGVSYTPDKTPTILNSDTIESGNSNPVSGEWKYDQKNSRNSEAFNQDDTILKDNIDLDEDQSQSISSEIDIDTNISDKR